MARNILVLGASGQIGTDLTLKLREIYGAQNVFASDIRIPNADLGKGPFAILDALDRNALKNYLEDNSISEVYNMVAMLSATSEKYPWKAWDLNMNSLFNTLELLKEGVFQKLFWPSSIAVFGPGLEDNTAYQDSVAEPKTVYGISKLAGERWCEYFALNYNCDVRSIRYPGVVSFKTEPGGGTTDYAVDIFHKAIEGEKFQCFLSSERSLPMMYMDDAVRATVEIMKAPKENIKVKSSYNISAISFSPEELASEIKRHIANFDLEYSPDERDGYAQSWPSVIDDQKAKDHWNWMHDYNLPELVENMLRNLKTLIHQ